MNVTVLGRGPSLLSVTTEHVLDGLVLAINGAIHHTVVPADYWVSLDKPEYISANDGRPWAGNAEPVVVTKAANVYDWKARWPDLRYVTYAGLPHIVASLPWKTAVDWQHFSILLALHYATIHLGARHFRLLGVDMVGTGYAYSAASVQTQERHGHQWRWSRERLDVAQALTELALHAGCTFDLGPGRELSPQPLRVYRCAFGWRPGCGKPPCPHSPVALAFDFGPMECRCTHALLVGEEPEPISCAPNGSPLDAIPRTIPHQIGQP